MSELEHKLNAHEFQRGWMLEGKNKENRGKEVGFLTRKGFRLSVDLLALCDLVGHECCYHDDQIRYIPIPRILNIGRRSH